MTRHALIIDDQPENSRLIALMLQDRGFDTHCSISAREGLQQLEDNDFSLLVVDLLMPEMNGAEATQLIRASSYYQHFPIFGVTGCDSESQIDQFWASGVDEVIRKPININELDRLIDIYLPG